MSTTRFHFGSDYVDVSRDDAHDRLAVISDLKKLHQDMLDRAEIVANLACNPTKGTANNFLCIAAGTGEGVAISSILETFSPTEMTENLLAYEAARCTCCEQYKPNDLDEDGECSECSPRLSYQQECKLAGFRPGE
jgi:hypothetical protein